MADRSKIFAALIIILSSFFIFFSVQWLCFLITPIIHPHNSAIDITVVKGSSVKSLAKQLYKQKIIKHPFLFEILVRIRGDSHKLQSGAYQLELGITPVKLVQKIASGDMILHSFTFVDGWTFDELIKKLANNPYVIHTLKGLKNSVIMSKIGHPGELPEGRFFPDTYKFSAGTKDIDILKLSYNLMQNKLSEAWNSRSMDAPYACPYKALIAASIIEKEASLSSERPIISGIIKRRLERNMYLQLDPTVIYGLGKHYNGKLTVKDLKKNTPFNTYLHKGLPPSPICMPSNDAIYAALHPAPGNVLYFVARGDGTHVFSETLAEHDDAIRKYQLDR